MEFLIFTCWRMERGSSCPCPSVNQTWQTGSGRVRLARIFHMIFLKKIKIKNNMYLSFGKSCNKLLDVKCITLNSPLISIMNSVKLINTYSIILKLYKSQHYQLKQNNTKISKINTKVLFLHNINIPKYKTKLQITY